MPENKIIDLSGDGGVLKEILTEGTGEETPNKGCKVSLHYIGKLLDGTVFDSSVDRNKPLEFDLGKGVVIKAFDMGIATMKLGERSKLTCAPNYAYGSAGGSPSIPPNATLIFEITMLGWKGLDVSPNEDGGIEFFTLEPGDKNRSPSEGVFVKVHLTGKYDDRIFDDRELQFDFGEGCDLNVINGVEYALQKMKVGETAKLKILPKYAFGSLGCKEFNIPPNATVEYIVKLIDCGKNVNEWKLSDNERMQGAKVYKEKGVNYYKKENYELAIQMYNKSVDMLPIKSTDEEVKKFKIAAHSNKVLCYQKLNKQFDAIKECTAVLLLDSNNIKALYRRGQCKLAINEFHEALEDFQKVVLLEPTNKAAINHITICKQKNKETKDREKKIFAKMFSKLATDDKEKSCPVTDSDVLAECGEWSEEDADLAFERDNNIIMI